MSFYSDAVSAIPVFLPRRTLIRMLRLVRLLVRISNCPAYREAVLPGLPAAARFDPGHAAVMMGYDFHLDAAGDPQLIEVNTNAGGGLLAWLASRETSGPAGERARRRFLQPFAEEMYLFSDGRQTRPRTVVILDENPMQQFLYREMQVYADLFREWGARTWIADPAELEGGPKGIALAGEPIELLYNRHCDFYLQSPALTAIRDAYLAGTVCLTPNPFIYGLLADKKRLPLWSDADLLASLPLTAEEIRLLTAMIPQSRLLRDWKREELWRERSGWVFKPTDRFASRGVFLGRKISRARFDDLPEETTLVQREIPPSETPSDRGSMKTDFRLFAYREHVLGVTARLYQGQVTNLRTPGGGFAAVRVVA